MEELRVVVNTFSLRVLKEKCLHLTTLIFDKGIYMKFWSNSDTPDDTGHVPEKKLLAAVLQRAVTDYVSGEGDLKETARRWLFLNEPSDSPLKFLFICEALDLDVDSLRAAIVHQEEVFSKEGKDGVLFAKEKQAKKATAAAAVQMAV